ADDHAVARLHDRCDGGLETGAAGSRHGERASIARVEREARQLHHLVHDRGELGIELAEQGHGHRAQHARIGHRGTGAQEDARTGQELSHPTTLPEAAIGLPVREKWARVPAVASPPAHAASRMLRIADVSGMDRETFIRTFGAVFEQSPWVAEHAWAARPF